MNKLFVHAVNQNLETLESVALVYQLWLDGKLTHSTRSVVSCNWMNKSLVKVENLGPERILFVELGLVT